MLLLRGKLERALAVVEMVTTAAFFQKSDDTNGAALVVVPANSSGVESATGTSSDPVLTKNGYALGTGFALMSKPDRGSGYLASCAANNNATLLSSGSRDLHHVSGYNAAATVIYVKFFHKSTTPVPGTDTPLITLACAPTSAFRFNLGGLAFPSGIGYAITTGAAALDNTAPAAGDILALQPVLGALS